MQDEFGNECTGFWSWSGMMKCSCHNCIKLRRMEREAKKKRDKI